MIKILKYKFSKKLLNSITLKMMQKILDTTNFFFFFHLLVCTLLTRELSARLVLLCY